MIASDRMELRCDNESATERLASRLADWLKHGDVLLLDGPVGAGKTRFVRALAATLGSADNVTSPTYTLMHHYRTAHGTLIHMDVYRLSGVEEYLDLGILDLAGDAITAVEWGAKVAEAHPECLFVEFDLVPGQHEARIVRVGMRGARWRHCSGELREHIACL